MRKRAPVDWACHGSVRLPIYFSPLKKKLARNGGGSHLPKFKKYDSFILYFYENGLRRKRRFSTLQTAREKGKALAKTLAKDGD